MKRREFIALLGGAAVTWPLGVKSQEQALPVVGFLNGGRQDGYALRAVPAFRQGLSETGYIADVNVKIEYHWAEDHYDRLPVFLSDMVRRPVIIIAATTTPAALAAKAATSTIPMWTQRSLA